MPGLTRISLAYSSDSQVLFEGIRQRRQAIFLDSAHCFSQQGRFDILAADPQREFTIAPDNVDSSGIEALKQQLLDALASYEHCPELPFSGGAIGFLSYDLGEQLQLKRALARDDSLYIGIYPWAVIVDHQQQESTLLAQSFVEQAELDAIIAALTNKQPPATPSFKLSGDIVSTLPLAQYKQAFEQAQRYITAGDCYQVNLTRQFSADYQGDPWQAYCKLREAAAAPFSAYMAINGRDILSLSPERFLAVEKGELISQPIKGTAARHSDDSTDDALATALQNSEKNRAENVMIVDLLRNDMSRSCEINSVVAKEICALKSFRTVHHLISTISGTLRADHHSLDALFDCFPGGSITGAPKKRAMEIIRELEPHRRSLYCGSIFYMDASGRMDSNIAIRSFVCEEGKIKGWAGGGIVADSKLEEEYEETNTKIGKLLKTLADC